MGIVEGDTIDGKGLGCECSGVIQAIGPDVQDLQVGDRVFMAGSNTYSTLLHTTANHCAKIPDSLSFSDAATMPCVYGTVVHGLLELAQLEAGQVSTIGLLMLSEKKLTMSTECLDPFRMWRSRHSSHQHLPHGRCEDLCNGRQPREDRASSQKLRYSPREYLQLQERRFPPPDQARYEWARCRRRFELALRRLAACNGNHPRQS
jgi:hypothetical protein